MDVKSWDELKAGLLVALSVMAAGVLVRLARGLPFTSVDHYEVDEVRQLTRAVDQIMRSLKLLVLVVVIGMITLVIALPLQKALETHLSINGRFWIGCAISGFIGLTLSYVCTRMWQVIRGDQELTSLQSAFVVRAVERKQAKRFEDQISGVDAVKFKAPDDYGKLVN
jgi:ABC-type amino acid transport system permease subunit